MTKSADSQQYTDGHCHRWPQHQHGRQQLHLLQVRSQSTLEATWKGKRGQNTSIKGASKKTPLCRPCAWSPRCLSSWARCRHRARIPGTQLPVAGTPHPVNWKVKTEETEPNCVFFYQMKECVRSYHCSAAPRMRDASPPIMVGRTEVSICLDTRKISAQI